MEITEVRIKLMEDGSDRLKAFCSITFDDSFVIRDLKIIEGSSGPFVAMPSRKLTAHCHECGYKNHLRANYCNQCGEQQDQDRAVRDDDGRAKLYADIAHPINSECREMIQNRVIEEFDAELARANEPGYISRYDEYDFEGPTPHITPRAKTEPTSDAPTTSSDTVDEPKPQIEQAENGPRAPHKRPTEPAPQRTPTSKQSAPKPSGGFGDGIF